METINKDETFNLLNYSSTLDEQKKYIKVKIEEADRKLTSLKTKEEIINTMINRTNMAIEDYATEKNYKLMGINNGHLLSQFETLSLVQEMLIKYEDQIQKYVKLLLDIENNKLSAVTKVKAMSKTDKVDDDNFSGIVSEMHKLMQSNLPNAQNQMLDHVKNQLQLEGY